jgi:hypothetical protein
VGEEEEDEEEERRATPRTGVYTRTSVPNRINIGFSELLPVPLPVPRGF